MVRNQQTHLVTHILRQQSMDVLLTHTLFNNLITNLKHPYRPNQPAKQIACVLL